VLRRYRPSEAEQVVPAAEIRRVYRIVGSLDLR
jgi:hypothetical protein